jgi:peptide/nickel transport system substrate-binding protein
MVENDEITGVVLSVFEDYYKQKPFLEQVIFIYYQDPVSALFALQQGEVMGISQITNDILGEALKSPNMDIYTGRLPQLNLIFFNLNSPDKPFLQDAVVRRALLMGLNRNWIIDRVMGGQAIIAHGPVFPESWAYYEGVAQIPYDSDQAIAMLKQAEYTVPADGGSVRAKDGVALSFDLVYPDAGPYPQIAEKIRSDWRVLGVEVNLVAATYEELIADYLEPRDYDAALVELSFIRSPDPDLYPFWHQSQAEVGQNYSQWDDRQASEYLEQARVTVDIAERTRRYRNFQVRFAAELPGLPLFFPVYSFGISNQVQGVSVGPFFDTSDRFNTITSWFLYSASADEVTLAPTVTP